MFKGFNNKQQHGFPSLSFFGDKTAYGQSGCNFWLRADMGLNTQTNLAAISRWVDIINGNIFEILTAGNQPRLLTSSVAYNNLPVVEFDSALKVIPTISAQPVTGVRSFAVIANYDVITTNNTILTNTGSGASLVLGGSGAGVNGPGIQSATANTYGTTDSITVKICVFSDNLIMVNGVVESTATNTINFSFDRIGRGGSDSLAFRGKIAEIVGFSFPLNQDQALAISTQLNQKYVIY
jgi:hypothetical protein